MVNYNQRKTREEIKGMRYTVKRFDVLKGWIYYNSFETYSEAREEADRLERIFKGKFEVLEED